jgi:hypothetical protein
MNIKRSLTFFTAVFALSLVVTAGVTLLWNFVARGTISVDWETSIRFAIVFGIVFTWVESGRSKRM